MRVGSKPALAVLRLEDIFMLLFDESLDVIDNIQQWHVLAVLCSEGIFMLLFHEWLSVIDNKVEMKDDPQMTAAS